MNYQLVYDVSQVGPDLLGPAVPLMLAIAGAVLAFKGPARSQPAFTPAEKRQRRIFGLAFMSFSLMMGIYAVSYHLLAWSEARRIYAQHDYQTVAGKVEHFVPMPSGGHASEHFEVQGVKFHFSDNDGTDYGYHRSAVNGGVISEGLQVRIGYFTRNDKNVIIRLETR